MTHQTSSSDNRRSTSVFQRTLLALLLVSAALVNIWSTSQVSLASVSDTEEINNPPTRNFQQHQPHPAPTISETGGSSSAVYSRVKNDLAKEIHLDDAILPPIEAVAGPLAQIDPDWRPFWGQHRSDQDVVMGVAQYLPYPELALFLGSLAAVNFTGDVVLSVDFEHWKSNYTRATQTWFTKFIPKVWPNLNLILYQSRYEPALELGAQPNKHKMMGMAKLIRNATSLFDPRATRSFVQLRFEFMALWIRHYSTRSRVGIFDVHDVHFQLNPFELKNRSLPLSPIDWHFTKEFGSRLGATAPWVKWSWGRPMLDRLNAYPPINPGTMLGGRLAAEVYLRAMVQYFDERGGESRGWGEDQAHSTVMAYTGYLVNHTSVQFHLHKQFRKDNPFTFLGNNALRGAGKARALVNDQGQAVNGPMVVPIVHKGVPVPCQRAEAMREQWVSDFERYYENFLAGKTTTS